MLTLWNVYPYDAVCIGREVLTLGKNVLLPYSSAGWRNRFILNVCTYQPSYTATQAGIIRVVAVCSLKITMGCNAVSSVELSGKIDKENNVKKLLSAASSCLASRLQREKEI